MQAAERRYTTLFLIGLFFLLGWSAWDYGGRYLHVQAISQVLSAGLALMLALQLLRNQDTRPLLAYPLLRPVLLFLLVMGMSWIFSVNRLASLEEIWRWIMYSLLPLAVYAWLRLMPDPERKVRWVLTGALLIGSGIAAAGFVIPSAESGLSSTFYRTNDLAGYLLLQVPLALHLLLTARRLQSRLGYGLLFLGLGSALGLTNSRSSWAACLLACALVLWFNRGQLGKKNLLWGFGGGALLLVAGIGIFWSKIGPRLQSVLSGQIFTDNAAHWRMDLIKGAWRMFMAHPLMGSGPNSFASAFSSYQLKPGYYAINPHNFYVQVLAETGILGLIALLIWLVMLVRELLRRPNPYSVGVLAGLAASLFHIGFDIDWSVSAIPILFAVLLGAGLVPAAAPEAADETPQHEPRAVGILIFVSLALALIPSLNYFSARAYGDAENGDPEAARVSLQRAMALAPWPSARHNYKLAQLELADDKLAPALTAATKSIQLDMHNARYYKLASDILLRMGRKPEALAMLLRCQELNPYRHPSIYTDIGDFYMLQMQEPLEAQKQYEKGKETFAPENNDILSNYERYTPSDRYEAFNLFLKLAAVDEKLNQTSQAQALRQQAQDLLKRAVPDMFVTSGYQTPVAALLAYWQQVPEHYKNPRHKFDSLLPDSAVQAPPPLQRLDASKIQFFHVERELFNASLMYAIPLAGQPQRWLLFEDRLVGDEHGWKIQARRSLDS